ncbi:L-aspartate oxidase [Methylotenera sp.]|uniref:L-aspartate oxidase n=1 Tax=Methylotenera sp. TaxID=2051956 RepID=UPI0027252C8C|nr:L-aspartate oxidase [Methylotenera sp.]MDO9205135.1 L-aspartate oxidase [Methylotenera sp.]MDO9394488.1 L-aspartate oxidase [Methylotenera sp.]MDP1522240.1 L-aspartate oxidase [Methylotenera sp.]MDP2071031.1 L-aspartate oxidase [Methylotenera sp.]MDP3005905.1 L-aspartate oxidase [Methylotenera sp.]
MQQFDVLIIGSGLAGLTLALRTAADKKVCLVSKRCINDTASDWAQGGIAAVLNDDDSIENHIQDTLIAGAGLCDEAVTKLVAEHAKEAVEWLIEQGVGFTRDQDNSGYHLTREGGHSHRRIIHAADATGHAVQMTLSDKVKRHPNITLMENHIAVDLITTRKMAKTKFQPTDYNTDDNACLGAYVLDKNTGKVITIAAQNTILATGGAGKVYLYTTNPDVSTGDGIAMAWRAGCRIANMEFIQFHPTCLFHPHAKSFLISEAVRGEGGLLKLPDGTRFMPEHDPREELAPRDVVARAIDFEMKKRGLDCVYLDITDKPLAFLKEHFPNIYRRCLELGIDISKTPIPVVPAAHYTCGGVMTDDKGRTDIKHLYAIGETACTGLHGANRLASNSLLECLIFGKTAAEDILSQPTKPSPQLPYWDESRVTDADEEVLITHTWDELRRFMWNYVGIVRTDKRLSRALHRIHMLRDEVHEFYSNFKVSNDLIELRNLLQVAELIVESAISRKESRGLHYSKDHPNAELEPIPTVLEPSNYYSLLDREHGNEHQH